MSTDTTRRALLGRAALAAPALALAPPAAVAEVADPHLAWAAEARALQARYHLVDDEEVDRLSEQVCDFHVLIGQTPARTLAGAREQLAVADALLGEADQAPVTLDHAAVRNALATLDRLAAAGRA